MDHRGARGSETNTGDGAGMLTALPDKLLRREAKAVLGIDLPEKGKYGVGNIFLPTDDDERAYCKAAFVKAIENQGQRHAPGVHRNVWDSCRSRLTVSRIRTLRQHCIWL